MSVSSYYSKLRSIWESISELKPAHSSTCNGICPWHNYAQMEYAMHFLMGLNESYGSIRGQILSMDPFPLITRIFSLVVQEEKQRELVLLFLLSTLRMMFHSLMPLLSRTPNISLTTSLMPIPRIDPSVHIVVDYAILKISASSYMVFPQITRRISLLLLILKAKQ